MCVGESRILLAGWAYFLSLLIPSLPFSKKKQDSPFFRRDVPLPFNSGESVPNFSTAKEKSSIIVEKKDENDGVDQGDNDKKDTSGASSGLDQSAVLHTSPIQVNIYKISAEIFKFGEIPVNQYSWILREMAFFFSFFFIAANFCFTRGIRWRITQRHTKCERQVRKEQVVQQTDFWEDLEHSSESVTSKSWWTVTPFFCNRKHKDHEKSKLPVKRKLDTSLDSSKLKKRGRPAKEKIHSSAQERDKTMMTSVTTPHNSAVSLHCFMVTDWDETQGPFSVPDTRVLHPTSTGTSQTDGRNLLWVDWKGN